MLIDTSARRSSQVTKLAYMIMISQFKIDLKGAFYDDGSQVVEKQEILKAVTECRRADTKEDYMKSRAQLMILCEHLNIRPGRVKNAVSFAQYFFNNWDRVAPMWVYAYRKELPLQVKYPSSEYSLQLYYFHFQGSGNTQACEAFFRALKCYEKQQFGQRLPSLNEMIPSISRAIDKRFLIRRNLVGHKRLKYYHENATLREALEEASWILNPIGMKVFFDNIKLCEQRWDKLGLGEDGVDETFSDEAHKTYSTDGQTCSCSYFKQMMFCRHIVFFRISSGLAVFEEQIFHPCLLKTPPDNRDVLDEIFVI